MRELKKKHKPDQQGNHSLFKKADDQPKDFFGVQAQLEVGKPGDPYEKEADAMADKVVSNSSAPEPVQAKGSEEEEVQQKPLAESISMVQKQDLKEQEEPIQPSTEEEEIQTKAEEEEPIQKQEEEEEPIQAKCDECEQEEAMQAATADSEEKLKAKEADTIPEKDEKENLQAKTNSGVQAIESPLKQSKGTGSGLDQPIKREMEAGFGADFSQVNIHSDANAANMSRQIGAQAFTHDNDIYFNEGKYNPKSPQGKHLLAHELTHTIQQKGMVQKKIQGRLGDGHDFPPASRFSRNVILEATFDNFNTVQSGSNGTHVTLIQNALLGLDYPLPRFGADGSFGDETQRAVKAFQEDVGITVDGIVGTTTIDFLDKRDRGQEVAPEPLPVVANTPINLDNVIAQPGAAPSIALGPGEWGLTFPENVQVNIEVFDNAGVWQPVVTGVTGNYSLQTRLLPGVAEVTGPGGNTTEANYCDQITDMNNLSLASGNWFMEAAIVAHERVHAEKFRDALIDPSVITPLETAIEGITIPVSLLASNEGIAELLIRVRPEFQTALTNAQTNWLNQILVLVGGDHGSPRGTGPTYDGEREILDPMIRRICNHARANGWPSCPPLCT
ncbi:eCIS core domain-containing protein [Echinicola vietnamensis]|uniref:Putative peptidoglycan-binding domain-containing protein n=1 Tax=Echinicola vietnamensis (strain DSM 17526 / LMG 23754 / KMM 6221) TaxID=926556 RepID=L0G457_ECHVK|nr:DUF4157 domain-containing protein [Echinicola vietnamensis]AGA79801.1 putative peptidoglycan-binding domain-containing protein [Echinicola vietnamensis DSM 17526]